MKQKVVLHDRSSILKPCRAYKPGLLGLLFGLCVKNIKQELIGAVILSFANPENSSAIDALINRFGFKITEKEYIYNNNRFRQLFKEVK